MLDARVKESQAFEALGDSLTHVDARVKESQAFTHMSSILSRLPATA